MREIQIWGSTIYTYWMLVIHLKQVYSITKISIAGVKDQFLRQKAKIKITNKLYNSLKSIACVTNINKATNYRYNWIFKLDLIRSAWFVTAQFTTEGFFVLIMLKNLNQPKLCNETRLVVTKFISNVIYATIAKEKFENQKLLICGKF